MPEDRARRDRSDVGNAADPFPDVPHEGLPDRTARSLHPGLLTLVPDSRAGVRSSSEWSGVVKNRRMTSAWAFFQPLLPGENLPSERARSRAADAVSNTVDSVIPMYVPHASAPVSGGSRRLTTGDSPLAVRQSQADRASMPSVCRATRAAEGRTRLEDRMASRGSVDDGHAGRDGEMRAAQDLVAASGPLGAGIQPEYSDRPPGCWRADG